MVLFYGTSLWYTFMVLHYGILHYGSLCCTLLWYAPLWWYTPLWYAPLWWHTPLWWYTPLWYAPLWYSITQTYLWVEHGRPIAHTAMQSLAAIGDGGNFNPLTRPFALFSHRNNIVFSGTLEYRPP